MYRLPDSGPPEVKSLVLHTRQNRELGVEGACNLNSFKSTSNFCVHLVKSMIRCMNSHRTLGTGYLSFDLNPGCLCLNLKMYTVIDT